MSYRRRNAYSSYYGSRGGSRGPADWLGLLALVCMLVCSVILLVRVLDAGVLTTALTVVFILVLVLLNGLHAFVQLPVRRSVAGKLICSVVALVLSAAMIFTSTAAGSFMKFLSNITSGGSAKTTVSVVVRADDKAETVNDTFGYTYGILEALDRTLINTGKMYVLWDDYGALRLSDVEGGRSVLAVGDGSLATGYAWESSIDSDTANQVKLVQDNKSTGKRDVYIVKDSARMRRWGVLQHYEKADKGLNAGQLKAQAQQMLEIYNRPSVKLELSALEGDLELRAGRSIYVDIADEGLQGGPSLTSAPTTSERRR